MLIQAYQKSWIEDFHKIKKVINEALINLPISIEHVGSTSIPGLAAKPIIDIDIVYDKEVAFDEIKRSLEKIGYNHNGNQGIRGREVFKRSKTAIIHDVLDYITHHLYVCPIDSEELQRHLLFRDYLTENDAAKTQYQNIKYEIAAAVSQDKKQYAALKEERARTFMNSIITESKMK